MRLLSTLLIGLVCLTAALIAAPAATAYDQAALDQAIALADAAWPDSSCQNIDGSPHLVVNVTAAMTIASAGGEAPVNTHPVAPTDENCWMRVRPDMSDWEMCVVVVHEAGHLAGREHTTGGVMDSDRPTYPPCDVFQSVTEDPEPVAHVRPDPAPTRARAAASALAGRSCRLTRGGTSRRYRCGSQRVAVTVRRDGTLAARRL